MRIWIIEVRYKGQKKWDFHPESPFHQQRAAEAMAADLSITANRWEFRVRAYVPEESK